MLHWLDPDNPDLPPLPRSEGPPPADLKKRVNGIRYLFCSNLNCVEPYCPTHRTLEPSYRMAIPEFFDSIYG